MGRGLMSNPTLLLLDEPSLGLAPLLINIIFQIIQEIQKMGKTILLVEQNAFKALSIADKVYVLNQGRVSMSGDAATIMADPSIREAYLGKTKQLS
jgi:branched-chain amino acid transport system ATP-binding protein